MISKRLGEQKEENSKVAPSRLRYKIIFADGGSVEGIFETGAFSYEDAARRLGEKYPNEQVDRLELELY